MAARRSLAVASLLIVALMLAIRSFGADEKGAVDVAKRQKAIAEKAMQSIEMAEKHGQVTAGPIDVRKWSKRLLEATRKSGATKAEVIEALKQHVARMDERSKGLAAKLQAGFRSVTGSDVLDAEYEALEARSWLDAEQAN